MNVSVRRIAGLAAALAFAAAVTLGCGEDNVPVKPIEDPYKYTGDTVTLGGLTWMAENLNRKALNSWCYGDDNSNCTKYGRLYTWDTAMKACPAGWRLPTRKEWENLFIAAGGFSTGAGRLKSDTGWNDWSEGVSGNGTDNYNFSALPAGRRSSGGLFINAGYLAYWWSATERGEYKDNAWSASMYYGSNSMDEYDEVKGSGLSVRCVR